MTTWTFNPYTDILQAWDDHLLLLDININMIECITLSYFHSFLVLMQPNKIPFIFPFFMGQNIPTFLLSNMFNSLVLSMTSSFTTITDVIIYIKLMQLASYLPTPAPDPLLGNLFSFLIWLMHASLWDLFLLFIGYFKKSFR